MNGQAKHAYDEGIVAIAGSATGFSNWAHGRISVAGIALDSQLLIQLAGRLDDQSSICLRLAF